MAKDAFREFLNIHDVKDVEDTLKKAMEFINDLGFNLDYEVKGDSVIIENLKLEKLKCDRRGCSYLTEAILGAIERTFPDTPAEG